MSGSARPRVLIVHDEQSHLNLYILILDGAGIDAVPALIPPSASEFLPEPDIDLILVDCGHNTTKITVEVAQQLRRNYPDKPIILMCHFVDPPAELKSYITEFVRKGDPETLLKTLRRHLPGSRDSGRFGR